MAGDDAPDDLKLLSQIADGDMKAVTVFYQRHESRVYRYAMAKVNDSFAASDILNDVMMQVWRSAAKFEGRAKVTTWLLGIAHNKVIDHWRKVGAREFVEIDDQIEDDTAAGANPFKATEAASDGKLLRACMDKLKPEHREVLHLVFFEELGYSEISGIINVPEGTVKSRVFHARNLMKQQLANATRAT